MASTGETCMASRAGASAERNATAIPARIAFITAKTLSATGAGRLLTYSELTVSAINPTAAAAITLPSATPASDPIRPSRSASAKNSQKIRRRLADYHQRTADVIEHYRRGGNVREVNGEGDIEEIYQRILRAARLRPIEALRHE